MQNIGDIWDSVNFVANKYLKGYLSPGEFNNSLAQGNNLWFNRKMSDRQQGNELALLALAPFKKSSPLTSDSAGLVTKPADYAETEGLYTTISSKVKSIRQILRNELQDALDSVIYPISDNPRFMENALSLEVYPKQATSVTLDYISKPTSPIFGFTANINGVVYDPTTSVQLQADKQYWSEIINLSFPWIGVNLSDKEISSLFQINQVAATN